MRLGCEMHDGVRLVPPENGGNGIGISHIGALEGIARIGGDGFEAFVARRVGQLVEVDDLVAGPLGEQAANDGGTDEAGAAGDENAHDCQLLRHLLSI